MTTDLGRKFATLALTIVFSSLCLIGAVGPAQSSSPAAVASAARFV